MNNIKAAVSLSLKNKIMSDNIEVKAEQINFIHYRDGDIEPLNQKSPNENTIGTCSFYETDTNQQFDFNLKFN
nr:12358_t:CDS:2 [Entrophospora candida]CAG8618125.1 12842_t:CDS:2 [Entrophospora candida]